MSQYMQPIHVLIVEDNPGDVDLLREGLAESRVHNTISVAGDGEEAISYLGQEPGYEDALRPDLIFLDLNLPRKNGREVLDVIKNDESLCHIPVVVLTSSGATTDVSSAYALRANAYVTKPLGLEQFMETVRAIETFWLSVVKLPRG
jgi:chemotaxis family two-component system response regulator Rcp1